MVRERTLETAMKKIDPKEIRDNAMQLIGHDWMLVTAGTPEHFNMMTASWGGLGVLWNKPMATIYVRPQRYTFQFLEESDRFTLSFFSPQWRKQLAHCGAVSGREEDKFAACGFHVADADGAPYVQEADLVLVCKKRYWNDLGPGPHGPRGPGALPGPGLPPDVPGGDYPSPASGLILSRNKGGPS